MKRNTTDNFESALRSTTSAYCPLVDIDGFMDIGIQYDGIEPKLKERANGIADGIRAIDRQVRELRDFFNLAESQGTDVHNYSLPNGKKIVEIADECYQSIAKLDTDVKELGAEVTQSAVLVDAVNRAHKLVKESVDEFRKWKEAEQKHGK